MQTLMSIAGMFVLLAIAYMLSTNRKAINRRTIMTAFAVQIGIAALIMFVPQGSDFLDVVVRGVQHVINFGNDGIDFVFGAATRRTLGFTIALNVLPVIVFFSALMSVLYYFGVMQWVISIVGGSTSAGVTFNCLCRSPLWLSSFMMSHPPTNSPLM